MARELGMTAGRLLREIDARELTEWMAFLGKEAEIDALMRKGTTADLAHEMVWGPPSDDEIAE